MTDAQKLADEHWKYVEEVLRLHGEDEKTIKKIGFHYRSSMVHGVKHGKRLEKQ